VTAVAMAQRDLVTYSSLGGVAEQANPLIRNAVLLTSQGLRLTWRYRQLKWRMNHHLRINADIDAAPCLLVKCVCFDSSSRFDM
jgi:hypothetical protein